MIFFFFKFELDFLCLWHHYYKILLVHVICPPVRIPKLSDNFKVHSHIQAKIFSHLVLKMWPFRQWCNFLHLIIHFTLGHFSSRPDTVMWTKEERQGEETRWCEDLLGISFWAEHRKHIPRICAFAQECNSPRNKDFTGQQGLFGMVWVNCHINSKRNNMIITFIRQAEVKALNIQSR